MARFLARGLLVSTLLLLFSAQLSARTILQPPAYFDREGAFVTVPSKVVGYLFLGVGSVLATPLAAISGGAALTFGDDVIASAMVPVSLFATGFAEAGYHLGAAPFWGVKKTVYDGPVYLANYLLPEKPSGLIAEVEPIPPQATSSWLDFMKRRQADESFSLARFADEADDIVESEAPAAGDETSSAGEAGDSTEVSSELSGASEPAEHP